MAEKKGNLSRKEREFLRHRQEVLDVALDLFSEKGFHNVTMHEIAKESEFAVGTLYKFFSNKEDLYKALIVEKSDEFHSALSKAIESDEDEMGAIKAYLETYIRVFTENLKFVRLYLAETKGASFSIRAGLEEELKEKHEEVLNGLAEIFNRAITKKCLKRFDPYLLATALEGITHAFLVQHLDRPNKHPFDADLIITLFFENLLKQTR